MVPSDKSWKYSQLYIMKAVEGSLIRKVEFINKSMNINCKEKRA